MKEALIGLALIMGLCAWIVHLLFIVQSLRSKKRWTIFIDYNSLHEGVLELLLILGVIIFNIYSILKFL